MEVVQFAIVWQEYSLPNNVTKDSEASKNSVVATPPSVGTSVYDFLIVSKNVDILMQCMGRCQAVQVTFIEDKR